MTEVVVTGIGLVTPLGNNVPATWEALLAGRSGIAPFTRFDAAGLDGYVAGEVHDLRPEQNLSTRQLRQMDRSSHMAVVAAMEAVSDAHLMAAIPFGARAGVAFGASLGGRGLIELQTMAQPRQSLIRLRPSTLANILPDASSSHLAIVTGATGPNMAILSASASGASAIGVASEIIRRGDADIMIAGASEAPLTPVLFAAFAAMRAMARPGDDPEAACKPFDLHRSGFVVAEGAGALVLENLEHAMARGASIYAELAGYGLANDAFDMVASEPEGRGPILAMNTALRKAGLNPEDIGYVNAHGTASRMNDLVETLALKRVFGAHAYRMAVSSTKSMTGHLMGAAGAVEGAISVLALRHQILPPTINYRAPDPQCDLDYVPNQSRRAAGIKAVLSHSIGLGGHNASLIFRNPAF